MRVPPPKASRGRTVPFLVRMTAGLRARLKKAADLAGVDQSALVCLAVSRECRAQGC
jgi:hypothetical protein